MIHEGHDGSEDWPWARKRLSEGGTLDPEISHDVLWWAFARIRTLEDMVNAEQFGIEANVD